MRARTFPVRDFESLTTKNKNFSHSNVTEITALSIDALKSYVADSRLLGHPVETVALEILTVELIIINISAVRNRKWVTSYNVFRN